ncbi:hypothetical protein BsWGS_15353 [Bradybaena similaris]
MALNATNDLDFVTRFVCTGSEEGCHSVLPKQDYLDKIPTLHSLLSTETGPGVIERLRTIFEKKSFVTKDPLLFALATIVRKMPVAVGHDGDPVRQAAYDLALDAIKTPMDLFTFVSFDKVVSGQARTGWGRGMKRIVKRWYESKAKVPLKLARATTRCKSGHGWTHRDLIRQAHICPDKMSKGAAVVLNYLAQGRKCLENSKNDNEEEEAEVQKVVEYLKGVEQLTRSTVEDKELIRNLIEKHKLIDRQIPSHLFQVKETFEGLLGHMKLADIFRRIPKMASLAMLDHAAPEATKVIEYIGNFDDIKKQNVPPIVIYVALRRYETNKAKKWVKNHNLVKALHAAFNASLQCLPTIGTRTLLAIHIDSRLTRHRVAGANYFTPVMPCALMTKFLTQSETNVQVVYFHQTVTELKILPKMPVIGIEKMINKRTKEAQNGQCDLSLPLNWAAHGNKQFDNILIISDKKSDKMPVVLQQAFFNALNHYRTYVHLPNAKLAFIGLSDHTVTGSKSDLNMLKVSGFSERVPGLIYSFFTGNMDFS